MTTPRRIAVLDVGKSNIKTVLVDGTDGTELFARTTPNVVRQDGPYPHVDVEGAQDFFVDALAAMVAAHGGFEGVAITAHGATGALVDGESLAMPVLDYEYAGPDRLAARYDAIRPAFSETFSPRLPGGLNLGAQLFWKAETFPDAFAASRAILTYPQFWAFWLTGVAATEATSLGAHTDLWAPRAGAVSSLVAKAGWTARMAPLRSAFDVLGPLKPAIADRIGLRGAVPVTCGIHDSNASLLPHIQNAATPRAVVSTGTWVICFAPGGSLDVLDPARDTLANVDAYGRPVPSARFMGGREFDILTGRQAAAPDAASVAAVVARQAMALPTFAPGNGPFPHGEGRWTVDPSSLTPLERTAAASLYVALMTATCLDIIAAEGPAIVEGPFARNALFCTALGSLTGRPVVAASGSTGTAAGAARLVLRDGRAAEPRGTPAAFDLGPDFTAYAAAWRRSVAGPARNGP